MQGLRAIREAKVSEASKYSQAAVAAAVGISKPTLRKYERDPGSMTLKTAERLAAYLGCSVTDIFLPSKSN